ncbi:histidine phosphatase family protein [Anaerovorax odorimutans]|uniref:Histidine phosphatase family protein n=1 Tax=Anaerovorax odorimutans TaxID=109327 RepID=A0ABT1RSL0_9FIRM|nr:histidine phosphatase family protein [Anaerovorax odorimutans]MCQ4638181.1 histidine phosphatase family protein [Anaerovorax odorimutans]
MELYIVRHGITQWNKERRIQGSSDIPLAEEGREMARKTAVGLAGVAFDFIYSSPLSRAYETASIIKGERDLKIQKDERLQEMSFGVGEGAAYIEPGHGEASILDGFYDQPDKYCVPEGGESFYDVCHRADSFLEDLRANHGDKERILIVAHAAVNQTLFRFLEGMDIKDLWKYPRQPNCAATIAELTADSSRIVERDKVFY